MSDIKPWLEDLGLGQYVEVFAVNDVDLAIVPSLSEHDLEKLGLSLGHRRKLIAAAAKLGPVAASSAEASRLAPVSPQVERRQVTVVFADLVGSTSLAAQLDPEDLGKLLQSYRDSCAAMVVKFDGYVAQYLGDGVLAYFGYPQALEQAAERAIRSALDIVGAVERLQPAGGFALRVRVGVATGLVVGTVSATSAAREQTVVGDAPNLAARLQALAAPGEVLVGPATRRLTGEFFDYALMGEHALKGFDQPVPVWKVLGERKIESRFAAARGAFAGPIVARERELAFLADSWQRAVRGNGHVVLLAGEAGMGKSRLLEALVERVRDEPHRRLRCQCSPYHRNSVLYPVIQLLRHEAAVLQGQPVDESLRSIEALLGQIGRTSRRDLLLIAELLELPTADRLSPMEMTPAQRHGETLAILEDFLLATPDGSPVLLLLEDAHWSDPTTQALVERLLARIETQSALVVITHRPEFSKPWSDRAQATTITCKQLGPSHCAAMVRRAAAQTPIADALIEQIVSRSDGVPLYVEELTKAVLDMQSVTAVSVPLTLRDSLMARLDRLGVAKEIALVASVIGRQFSEVLLAATAGTSQEALRAALDRLIEAGLVFATGELADGDYSFNHSLVQEAAYASLSNSRRQALHRQIASVLEAQSQTQSGITPEILAHHFGRAAEPQRACAFWIVAAEKATRRSAYTEAIANLHTALAEAERIADAATRNHEVLEVQLKLGATFIIQAGPLSADAASVLALAHALAKQVEAEPQLFQATWGLYINAASSRQFDEARTLGDELLAIGDRLADDDMRLEGLHHRWGLSYFTGQTAKTLEYALEGASRYDSDRHHRFAHVFAGHDPGVCANCVAALALGLTGRSQDVAASVDAAIALADSLPHPATLAFSLGLGSVAQQLAGDLEACRTLAEREERVGQKYDLPLQLGLGRFMQGLVQSRQGDLVQGVATMQAHHPAAIRHGFLGAYPDVMMADGLARAGQGKEALALVTRTLETLTMPEVGIHVSELWRLRGELALADSAANSAMAESWLRTAVRIAASQEARAYQQRAEAALADLLD